METLKEFGKLFLTQLYIYFSTLILLPDKIFPMQRIELYAMQPKEIAPGYHARFVHTAHNTFSYVDVEAGSVIAEHSHIHEQVCWLLEGKFQLTIEDQPVIFEPGTVIIIPPNAKHSGLAITDCKVLDVFYPVREDYKNML